MPEVAKKHEHKLPGLAYHWEQVEGDPLYPGDNQIRYYPAAICNVCDEDVTQLVGDYDPDIDGPIEVEA